MNWEGVANKMQIFFAFNIFRVVQVSSSLLVCASGLHFYDLAEVSSSHAKDSFASTTTEYVYPNYANVTRVRGAFFFAWPLI